MKFLKFRSVPAEQRSSDDLFRLAFRPDWASAIGVVLGLSASVFLAGWGGSWLHLTDRLLAVSFPLVITGFAFGCHRFLVVRASCFDFATGEFRMRTTWVLLVRGAEARLPLKLLPPVETGPVNQNDMAPSWGIFVRLPGTTGRTALNAGQLYKEAADLAAVLNRRRALTIDRSQATIGPG